MALGSSTVRYTRWPNPMILSPRANRSFTYCSARSTLPISSSIRMASSLAPPCSGPFSAAMAATTAEWMSDSVDATTRAVKVEAFMVWSA